MPQRHITRWALAAVWNTGTDWGCVQKTAIHSNLLPSKHSRRQPLLTYGAGWFMSSVPLSNHHQTTFWTCTTPCKHFGGMMSGFWELQYQHSANQVFQCPFIEVTPFCCWLIHIYNDKRFALTSSPLQKDYYRNANSTIAVMTLFYNAHISGTFANGLKKGSS